MNNKNLYFQKCDILHNLPMIFLFVQFGLKMNPTLYLIYMSFQGISFLKDLDKQYKKEKSSLHKLQLQQKLIVSNEEIYREHKEREDDTVMVSPSMTHGIDLKDNLGEFQIILKAPYSPLNDDRIKKKFNEDKEWYQNKV